jgi:hypothetical protein
MTIPEAIEAMRRNVGQPDEAIFRLPAPVMADWFRERGHDDVADRLAGTADFIIVRVRDYVWLNTSEQTKRALLPFIREVYRQLASARRNGA